MLLCDNCNKSLENGYVCTHCRRLLCKDCSIEFLCGCDNKLEFSIAQDQIKTDIQWVIVSAQKWFGLSGFNSMPTLAYHMFDLISTFSPNYEVILVDSRTHSKQLVHKLGNNQAKNANGRLFIPKGPGSKHSRYSLLMSDNPRNKNTVLINVNKTKESSLSFLLIYFNKFFAINSTMPSNFDSKKLSSVGVGLTLAFEAYNSKFGINFFSFNEEYLEFINSIYIKLRISFIDYLTLKQLSTGNDYNGDLSDFIANKIETLFTIAPKSDIYLFLDTLNVWGLQTEGFTLVNGLSLKKQLQTFAKNKFLRENSKMIKCLAKHPDLTLALNNNVNSLELQSEYDDFDGYINSCCKRLEIFVKYLNGEYAWLPETTTIIDATKWYEEAVNRTRIIYHPTFGTVDNFISILAEIFYKGKNDKSLYPEVAVIAGQSLMNFLRTLILANPDDEYVEKVFTMGPEVAEFLINSHDEIKRKHPDSPFLDLEIPVLILTGLVQVCINHKKFERIENLLLKCENLGIQYDLPGILVTVYWTRFIFYQDYESLLKVYKLYDKIVTPKFVKPNDFEILFRKMQAFIALGVFEQNNKLKHYSDALKVSENFPFSVEDSNDEDFMHQRMSEYIAHLFYYIEKANTEESIAGIQKELNDAKPFALSLESELVVKTDAANIFAWKTLLILAIVKNNAVEVDQIVRKIDGLPLKSKTNDLFSQKAKAITRYINDSESVDPLIVIDLPIEKRDPWSRLLEKLITIQFKTDLQNKLKFISRAIVFVEGPTEVNVIPIWAKTLGIDLKRLGIGVISLKGAPKANYHLRLWKEVIDSARALVNNKHMPIYMVLDLNAKYHGEEAVAQGLISRPNCFTLSLGDIEDYYPIDALKKILEKMCGKEPDEKDLTGGRVHAIDHFLRKNGYYDDWKISLGTMVAKLTTITEIPIEIQNIIRTIAQS